MPHRAPKLGRRSFALTLAYLLALQVIFTAWTVLLPAVGGLAPAQGVICTTHARGSAPASDLPPTQCPCGPMCHAGAAPMLGAPPDALSVAIAYVPAVLVVWPADRLGVAPDISGHPGKARAPPLAV